MCVYCSMDARNEYRSMAKSALATGATDEKGEVYEKVVSLETLSAKTRKLVEAVRPAFTQFAADFEALTVKRSELAPKLMKAYGAVQSETGISFVGFVRLMDPTVPVSREAYRAHKTYAAADYLRRLAAGRPSAAAGPRITPEAETPLDVLSRLVAAILPNLDAPIFWTSFAQVCAPHWSERQMTTLRSRVESLTAVGIKPIPIRPPKPVKVAPVAAKTA